MMNNSVSRWESGGGHENIVISPERSHVYGVPATVVIVLLILLKSNDRHYFNLMLFLKDLSDGVNDRIFLMIIIWREYWQGLDDTGKFEEKFASHYLNTREMSQLWCQVDT